MRPVKNDIFKKEYLYYKFWSKIDIKCDKAWQCIALSLAKRNRFNWGFHHMLKDDKGNRKNYPDVIDCLFFLEYLPNCCHTNCSRYPLKHITPHQAEVRQNTLNKPKWEKIKHIVNCEGW